MPRLTEDERRRLYLESARIWAEYDFQDPDRPWKQDGYDAEECEEARMRYRAISQQLALDRAARRREERRKAKRFAEGKTWAES